MTIQRDLVDVAKWTGLMAAGRFARVAFQLVTGILITRVLGAGDYGIYAICLNLVTLATEFGVLGLDNANVRFVPIHQRWGDGAKLRQTVRYTLTLTLALGTGLALVLFVTRGAVAEWIFHEPRVAVALAGLVLVVPLGALQRVAFGALRGMRRMEYQVLVENILIPVAQIVLLVPALVLGFRLWGAVGAVIGSYVIATMVTVRSLHTALRGVPSNSAQSQNTSSSIIGFAVPMFISGLAYTVMVRIDVLLIGYFLPTDQVGIYSAASRLLFVLTFIIPTINYSVDPLLSECSSAKEEARVTDMMHLATRWIALYIVPVAVALAVLGEPVLALFGPEFRSGATALAILVGFRTVGSLFVPVARMLAFTGRPTLVLINTIAGLVLNVLLNVLLIPRFGIEGAAIAAGSGFLLVNTLAVIEQLALTRVMPFQWRIVKPLAAGAAVLIVVYATRGLLGLVGYQMFGLLPLIGIIYLAVLWLQGIEEEEQMLVHRFLLRPWTKWVK